MATLHEDSTVSMSGSSEINDFPSAMSIGCLGVKPVLEDREFDGDSGTGTSPLSTRQHSSSGESNEDDLSAIDCRYLLYFGDSSGDGDDGTADNEDGNESSDQDDNGGNVSGNDGNEDGNDGNQGDEDTLDGRRYHGRLLFTHRSPTVFASITIRSRHLQPHVCRICSRLITRRDCCQSVLTPVYITDPSPEAETSRVDFGLTLRTCTYQNVQRHFASIRSINDSLAARFEIRTGDELLMIGDRPVVDVNPSVVASFFRDLLVGEDISLIFRRLMDDNEQPVFQFVKSYGQVVGETYSDEDPEWSDSDSNSDSESEPEENTYRVRGEQSYHITVPRGSFAFILVNPDSLVKEIDSCSDSERTMAFCDGCFKMETSYNPQENKFAVNMLEYWNSDDIVNNVPNPETRYQFCHVSDERHTFLVANPPAVACKECSVMVDGCPVSSDVVADMWFCRKYNSTATHLYTFCMTSQQDHYLATSGGEIQVRHLPGDQSENEEIRFEVHDRS